MSRLDLPQYRDPKYTAAPTGPRYCPAQHVLPAGTWTCPTCDPVTYRHEQEAAAARRARTDLPDLSPVRARAPKRPSAPGTLLRVATRRPAPTPAPTPEGLPSTPANRAAARQRILEAVSVYWYTVPTPKRGRPAPGALAVLLPDGRSWDTVTDWDDACDLRAAGVTETIRTLLRTGQLGLDLRDAAPGVLRVAEKSLREGVALHRAALWGDRATREKWTRDLPGPRGPVRHAPIATRTLRAAAPPTRDCPADGVRLRGAWAEGDRQQSHKGQSAAHAKVRRAAAFVSAMREGKERAAGQRALAARLDALVTRR